MSRRKLHWRDRLMQAGQTKQNLNFEQRVKQLPTDVPSAMVRLAPKGMKQTSIARVLKQCGQK